MHGAIPSGAVYLTITGSGHEALPLTVALVSSHSSCRAPMTHRTNPRRNPMNASLATGEELYLRCKFI